LKIIIKKIQKVTYLYLKLGIAFSKYWECYHTLSFYQIPKRICIWENGNEIKLLCFFIYYKMKSLVFTTRTLPEFDRILAIFFKEFPKFSGDNMINIYYLSSLINAISNSKKLCFSGSDVDYLMNSLNDGITMHINVNN